MSTGIGQRIYTNIKRPDPAVVEAFRGIPASNIGDMMGRLYCTNGSIKPDEAASFAAKILTEHLMLFINLTDRVQGVEILVEKAGGIVAGRMAVLAEGEAAERDDIIVLAPLPLFNADGTPKA